MGKKKRLHTLSPKLLQVLDDALGLLLDPPSQLGEEGDLSKQTVAGAGRKFFVKDERARDRLRDGVSVSLPLGQLLSKLSDRDLETAKKPKYRRNVQFDDLVQPMGLRMRTDRSRTCCPR